jgi:hypothetical protein
MTKKEWLWWHRFLTCAGAGYSLGLPLVLISRVLAKYSLAVFVESFYHRIPTMISDSGGAQFSGTYS